MTERQHTGSRSGTLWSDLLSTEVPDRALDPGQRASVAALRDWVRAYLIQPHPKLGRSGPVCPFVSPAITHRTLLAACSGAVTASAVSANINDALEIYLRVRHDSPADAGHLAVVTVFGRLTNFGVIDEVHQALKSRFVARKLMLGQFYPGCAEGGLWNTEFRPLDAPLPLFVVRRMTPADYPFLLERPEWLHSYLDHFAPGLPARLRDLLTAQLSEADLKQSVAHRITAK